MGDMVFMGSEGGMGWEGFGEVGRGNMVWQGQTNGYMSSGVERIFLAYAETSSGEVKIDMPSICKISTPSRPSNE